MSAHTRTNQGLRWRQEWHTDAVLKERGLECVCNVRMHDGTVAIPRHIVAEALAGAPGDGTDLVTGAGPIAKAIENSPELLGDSVAFEVHEAVAEIRAATEIDGQVNEIILPCETIVVEQLQQRGAAEIIWQVPQHHCGLLPRCRFCFRRSSADSGRRRLC